MNRFRLQALSALALTSLVALASSVGVGCGQDVASCSTVCASDTDGDCATSCSGMEANCTAASASGEFQDLLTCIGNAGGTYDSVPPLCQSEQESVNSSCAGNTFR